MGLGLDTEGGSRIDQFECNEMLGNGSWRRPTANYRPRETFQWLMNWGIASRIVSTDDSLRTGSSDFLAFGDCQMPVL